MRTLTPYPVKSGQTKAGLGDIIERGLNKAAKVLHVRLPCHDAKGELVPNSPCGHRRDTANELGKKIGIG